ncbi:uncharacterized protein LOC118114382 [Hippoglossus stenolepis]|uniref:uncharacterized protein LOC118114382 n=1 Tax=Hippoglossus stenolepis TaxID=195615 RepID=UPI00159C4079|nr:uncharacterized protein LOC118114382 [Hippoglossus stenolepis]XP_035020724.1 uncharacterized protein LOC118114382 [Hippoglossus stenolepis]
MEKRRNGEMMTTWKVSHIFLLLMALLQTPTPSSAQNTTTTTSSTSAPSPAALSYSTRPADVTVAVGEPAVFSCGVTEASPSLSFTLYSSHGNYTLICPNGHLEDIPQALYGSCDVKNGESLAVWALRGTSFSDNGTRVVCKQSADPDSLAAVLHVYDDGTNYAILIGCIIGGFFGMLLVCGLFYLMLWRSDSFRKCFRGKETEDDLTTIVTKDSKKIES